MTEISTMQNARGVAAGRRFVLVDALRGIAAVAVLCHHLLFNSELQVTLWKALPGWIFNFCVRGAYGVEIFFVISGFVIAHSLRNVRLTPGSVGAFMLRRQLRLDPPYWTMLFVTVALLFAEQHVAWIAHKHIPTFWEFIANMFYLQNVTRSFSMMGVSWTLCLEVQFYLVFILLLLAGKALSRTSPAATTVSFALVAALAAVSILIKRQDGWYLDAWFIQWWYYFAAGAMCYWAVNHVQFRIPMIAFMVLFAVMAWLHDPFPMCIGLATTLLLFVAGQMGRLTSWLNYAPLQYLGKISYSLYLSHLLVADYVMRFGSRLTHTNPHAAVFWFFLAGAISIVAAHGLYLLVEKRSIKFGAKFRPAQNEDPGQAGINGESMVNPMERLKTA
jgi:peptidoglycan/LPS O-acetylase OafA/YrhL